MAYSQPNDIRNALAPGPWPYTGGGSAPKTGTAADLGDPQLVDAISEADAQIDLMLNRRYATPVADTDVPNLVRWWSRDIAAYYATLTYRKGRDLTAQDPVALRYNSAIVALTAVRDGKNLLNLPEPTSAAGDTGSVSGASAPINPYNGTLFGPCDVGLPGSDPAYQSISAFRIPSW